MSYVILRVFQQKKKLLLINTPPKKPTQFLLYFLNYPLISPMLKGLEELEDEFIPFLIVCLFGVFCKQNKNKDDEKV